MRRLVGFIVWLVALSLRAETIPPAVTLGFTPSVESEVLGRASQKLTAELSKALGTQVKAVVAKDYSELSEMLGKKTVDFAFLSSRGFVESEKKFGVKVLLKKIWVEPFYYSVILVRPDSKIKKMKDLKGHSLAWVDKKSTSGYLYPQVQLKKEGLTEKDFKEVIFSGSHAASVHLLESGKVDAIAVFSDDLAAEKSAWQKFRQEGNKKSRKIWASEPIPNDPFCVRQEFYDEHPKFTHTLMFSLIDAVDSLQTDSDVKSLLGASGFQPATSRQYDAVREMVQTLNPSGD